MDRIDVVVDVPRPESSKVISGNSGMSSGEMAEQVSLAAARPPASMLDARARRAFEAMARNLLLGGRGIARVTRVARTIADLAEHELVTEDDIVEAIAFRSRGSA